MAGRWGGRAAGLRAVVGLLALNALLLTVLVLRRTPPPPGPTQVQPPAATPLGLGGSNAGRQCTRLWSSFRAKRSAGTLACIGDVSLGRDIAEQVKGRHGGDSAAPFALVRGITSAADCTMANLESPFYDETEPVHSPLRKRLLLKAPRSGLRGLKDAGIDVVSLANNHILDFGPKDLRFTMGLLRESSILHSGITSGPLTAAQTPAVYNVGGVRIGILSYCSLTDCVWPRAKHGVGPAPYDDEVVSRDIKAAKGLVDFVVVNLHWGREYYSTVSDTQSTQARFLAGLGVGAVIGHHPHVLQDHAFVGATFVAYSLGNFLFDSHVCRTLDNLRLSFETSKACQSLPLAMRQGVAAAVRRTRVYRLSIAAGGALAGVSYLPARIVANDSDPVFQPVPAAQEWIPACGPNDPHCHGCT